jgi:hypothetical protein
MPDLIDTSTKEGGKQWALLCQRAFENLPTDTSVTFDDVDAILTWCLPDYERVTAERRPAVPQGFTVRAEWMNDGTAELTLQCDHCQWWAESVAESHAELGLLVRHASAHNCPKRTSP